MELGILGYYLISINVLGFILFAINTLLYTYTENGQIDVLLTITSLIGGALGIVLAIIIIDRQAKKSNMMSRVFVVCVLVVQIILFLFLRGELYHNLTFKFWEFFAENKLVIIYLAVINVATFITFAIDKLNAVTERTRIRIVTLLILCFLGGSIGGLLAMYLFRHKIRVDYFAIGVPMILVTQIILIFYIMNAV